MTKKMLKKCCSSLEDAVEAGYLIISDENPSDQVGLIFANSITEQEPTGLWAVCCPWCGKTVKFEEVIPYSHPVKPAEGLPLLLPNGKLNHAVHNWDTEYIYSRQLSSLEDALLAKILAKARDNIVDKGPSALRTFVWGIFGDRGLKEIVITEGHHHAHVEEYSCAGLCEDVTNHYLTETKAICSICLNEQARDFENENLDSVFHVWKNGKVVATITVGATNVELDQFEVLLRQGPVVTRFPSYFQKVEDARATAKNLQQQLSTQ